MPTYKLILAYDGTRYAGWQRQPNAVAVQNVLDDALARIAGEFVRTTGSSRTDSGVHAFGQVVGLSLAKDMPADALCRALNAMLDDDVVVRSAEVVSDDFDAIRSARRKRYRYVIRDGDERGAFDRAFVWHVRRPLDAAAMHEAGQSLVGTHDFTSFQTAGSERQSTVRTIYELSVRRGDAGLLAAPIDAKNEPDALANEMPSGPLIAIEVEGNGFLYNMVRAIAGTLVEVGRGKRGVHWPGEALAACDRSAAGPTAPPQGLFLLRVDMDDAPGTSA
ncbi:MAG: tRNA pseudouridine(38-40) synthase TruA [Pirellulales bacterium]